MATKAEIIAAVMADVGDRTSDAAVVALYRTWFDNALDWLLARWPWPYRRKVGTFDVTAAGFSTQLLPVEIDEIRFLRNAATRCEIVYMDYSRLLDAEVDLTQTGPPERWYYAEYDTEEGAQRIGFWPIPAEDLTVQYDAAIQVPLPLEDDADVPIPREAVGILHEAIRAYSYENENQLQIANNCWTRAFSRLERLVGAKGASRPERKRAMRPDGDLRSLRPSFRPAHILSVPDPDA